MTATSVQDITAPFLLRDLTAWLIWRYEKDPKGKAKKLLKVPYYAKGQRRQGVNGSPEDVSQLVDFESAKRFANERGFEGVGFAFLPEFGITCIDYDDCIVDGRLDPEVERTTFGTYAEYSPSGNGIHVFVTADLGDRKSKVEGTFGVELFNTKIWVTFTGRPIEICEVGDFTNTVAGPNKALKELVATRFGAEQATVPSYLLSNVKPLGVSLDVLGKALSVISPDAGYNDWFKIGSAIHHETSASEEGFVLWDSWSSNSPKYNTEDYNRYKWSTMGRNTSIKPYTAASLIKYANTLGAAIPFQEGLTEEDFCPILEEEEGEKSNFFNIRSAAEFAAQIKPISWIIKGFLPKATLGVLYGESGSGKSFLALDICASIARQMDWNGLRCQKQTSRILYVAAEGVGGFANRLSAYCHQTGISIGDLKIDIISDVVPNLMDGISVGHLIKDIIARDPYDLVIMDTFAQVTPGANENSGEDMGRALGYCRKISQSTGAMVLLIHHSGKDASKGARGWSGVNAAADVVYEVSRVGENRCVKVAKQKDGKEGGEYGFKLLEVFLGEDKEGDPIISCVVDYCPVVKEVKQRSFHKNQKIIADALADFTEGAWTTVEHALDRCMDLEPKDREGNIIKRSTLRTTIRNGIGDFIEQNENGEIRIK